MRCCFDAVRCQACDVTSCSVRECHSVDIDDVSQPVKLRPNVSCEVLGGLGDRPSSHTYAMCTLDGCLLYVRDKQVVW